MQESRRYMSNQMEKQMHKHPHDIPPHNAHIAYTIVIVIVYTLALWLG